jgi:GntR family transcriptional regulator
MTARGKVAAAAATLRQRIVDGDYAPGGRMPSVSQIAAEFGISTSSAGSVITRLRGEGLIVTRHGAGTFVREFRPIQRSSPGRLSRTWSKGTAIQDDDTGPRPRTVEVTVASAPAPEWVAEEFGIDSGNQVIVRARRIAVDDRAVQLATSYYLPAMAEGTAIVFTDTGPGGAYARLAEIGHEPVEFTETLRCRMPYPAEASTLDLPAGTPVIDIRRTARDGAEQCVEVTGMVLDASAYRLDYTFGR